MNQTIKTTLLCSLLLAGFACHTPAADDPTGQTPAAAATRPAVPADAAPPAPAVLGTPLAPPPNPPVMATYDAPAPIAEKVAGVLRSLVAEGENPAGRVAALPGGRIVVVAPASIQDGVRDFIEHVRSGPLPPPPATIRIRYWLVLGRPAAEPSGLEQLAAAAPALEAVMASTGPLELRLLDRVEAISLENEHATAAGRRAEINQRAARAENGVFADLHIGTRARLDTRVLLEPGKLVVLGQVGYDERESAELFGDAPDSTAATQGATLFHVVQAEVVAPPGA
ncbi:MAG: hypothetical protein JXB32_22330 [Deltaproteobacteria bacterium]|nr:hypothetical protein [Deltaproteobacteria bacterium]